VDSSTGVSSTSEWYRTEFLEELTAKESNFNSKKAKIKNEMPHD
jgi:hypothetical protein